MKRKIFDIDAQIAALEAGHSSSNGSDSGSDSDSDGGSDNTNSRKRKEKKESKKAQYSSGGGIVETVDESGAVVIMKSSISDEAPIAPLAAQHLPAADCGNTTKKQTDATKKKKLQNKKQKQPPTAAEQERSGLEKTVMEMLRNYQPSSSEKRPFWCRVCRFQGTSAEALMAHRETKLHVVACQKERRMSFCKLCKIQFTSPDQLKEHLRGAKHEAKLDRAKQNQQGGINSHGKKYVRI